MKIGSFSYKVFRVNGNDIKTIQDLERSSSLNTDEVENGTDKPKLTVTSKAIDTMSFSVALDYRYLNVSDEYSDWMIIKDDGQPFYLILGGKSFGDNKWLLTDVNLSDTKFAPGGKLMNAKLQLSFKEYFTVNKKRTAKATRKK